MPTFDINFEAFKARKLQEGYDQVLEEFREPQFSNELHRDRNCLRCSWFSYVLLGGPARPPRRARRACRGDRRDAAGVAACL
jgi:hypothetical protein